MFTFYDLALESVYNKHFYFIKWTIFFLNLPRQKKKKKDKD